MKINDNQMTVSNVSQFSWGKVKVYIGKLGIYLAFLALCVVLSVLSPAFLSISNIINVVKQVSINTILAIGVTFVIISGGIDLSIGSVLAFSGVVAALFGHPGEYPLIVPIVLAVAVGTLLGAITGFGIAYGKLAPFIMTLGMMTIARGAALVTSGGGPVINISEEFESIAGGFILGIPRLIYISLIVFIIGCFVLNKTLFGRHVYAIGGNETAAKVSGLNVERIKVLVYSICGGLSGLGGLLLASRITSGSPIAGSGYELDAIAAAVIGGVSMSGGAGKLYGTIVGALIIGVMNNGLDILDVSSYFQQIIKGLIIILAVYFDTRSKLKD